MYFSLDMPSPKWYSCGMSKEIRKDWDKVGCTTFSLRLPNKLAKELTVAATKERRSRNEQIVVFLTQSLERYKREQFTHLDKGLIS